MLKNIYIYDLEYAFNTTEKKIMRKKELSFLAYNIHQCKRIALIVPVLV